MEAELCLPPPPSPEFGYEDCAFLPNLPISPLAVSGTTIWTDGALYFDNIVSEITNGVSGQIEAEVTIPSLLFG